MGSAGTILVVDDDHGVREALETALSTRYQVHTAPTASAALDALAAHQFDLILLDYRLPDLLGTSVLQTTKRFFPSTLVILMAGFGTEDVAVQALRGGARDYIRKPVDFRDLHSRIAAFLALCRAEMAQRLNPYVHQAEPLAPWPLPEPDLKTAERGRAILKALRYMDEHLDSGISPADVARAAGMSKYHFCRRFKASTGLYFREYLARRRIAKAKELLRDTSRTVTDVFREVGFKDMTHFGRVFKKLEGKLPSEFRRRREAGSPRVASQVGEKNPSI
jgi:two-component system response regulator YesN